MKTLESRDNSEKPTVVLMVNDKEHCNASCDHCYLPYKGVRQPENVLELVDNLKSRFNIVIAGSETLTDLGYLEAYRVADQKYILTNGLLLFRKPEIFKYLEEYGIEEIRMSYHFGIQKDLHSVPKHVVRQAVQQAKEKCFRVQIAVTITPENCKAIDDMCDQVHDMGADEITFFRYVKSGSAKEEARGIMTDEEIQEFFLLVDAARKRYEKDELSIIIKGIFGPKKGSKGEELSRRNEYCPAGEKLFVICPDGKIYACPFLMEHPIGELTEDFRLRIDENLCNGRRDGCLTDILLES